jgi:hypothetical protein
MVTVCGGSGRPSASGGVRTAGGVVRGIHADVIAAKHTMSPNATKP